MDGTVIDRAPQAHCHRCGAAEIAGVCTHCQQCMCQAHLPPAPRRVTRWIGRLLRRLRVVDQPYDGSALLCRDCQARPLVPFLFLILLLAIVYMIAGAWIWAGGAPGGAGLVAIGLLWLGLLWGAGRYLTGGAGRRETIAVTPRIDKRQIQEWARGHIVLDPQGDYTVKELSAEGRLTLGLSFSEADQKRVASFVNKQRKASRKHLRYHAGFVVLKGPVSNRPLPSPAFHVKPLSGPVVALHDRIADASFLTSTGGRAARQWEALYGYALFRAPEARTFPVQVLPAIRPDSEQRVLDLTVQWASPVPGAAAIAPYQIGLLRLEVPTSWGGIEYASGGLKTDVDPQQPQNASTTRVLRWERVSLSRRDLERQQRVFTIKFEQPVQQQDILRGAVHVSFWNSLSAMTGVECFLPSGKPSPLDESAAIATIVVANFDLSLATLRYQKTLVCPDPQPPAPFGAASPEAAGQTSTETPAADAASAVPQDVAPRIAAIPPDADTVAQLTNALSEANFYIQWIVENRPQTGAAASVTHRYWDIGGRYYQGVNPVDFHLMVTGQQSSMHGAAGDGQTAVSLTVKGAYVTEAMRREIVNVWRRLDDVVAKTLESLEQPASAEV